MFSQGIRPQICQDALFAFPLNQSSLQERQAPASEHNTTQDVCLVLVYLRLCIGEEEMSEKLVQEQS